MNNYTIQMKKKSNTATFYMSFKTTRGKNTFQEFSTIEIYKTDVWNPDMLIKVLL